MVEVHTLCDTHRQLLLEMLASELDFEPMCHVGIYAPRDHAADGLCGMGLARWATEEDAELTPLGRHVAGSLAEQLTDRAYLS